MKTIRVASLSLLAAFAMAFTNPTDEIKDGNYSVSVSDSEITWNGKKVTGQHFGTIQIKDGGFEITEGKLTGGSFTIDMTTIANTDMEGDYSKKLEGHLKSDDFFGVSTYPTANFRMTRVISNGTPGAYRVMGDMTIKSTTKPVKFDTILTIEDGKVVATAEIVIDRSEYDVRYGSGSFFDDLGDKTIYDDFTLQVKLVTE